MQQCRVSVQGVQSLDSHFACLCQEFDFYEAKKKRNIIIFQKEKENTFIILIFFIVKVFKKSKIAQIYYPHQSESTSRRVTLP